MPCSETEQGIGSGSWLSSIPGAETELGIGRRPWLSCVPSAKAKLGIGEGTRQLLSYFTASPDFPLTITPMSLIVVPAAMVLL